MKENFDLPIHIDKSKFVKYNSHYLEAQFGTTNLTSFWIADMDLKVMPRLIERLKARAEEGVFCYEYKPSELKKTIANWFNRRHSLIIHDNHLMFTPSVLNSLAALIDEFTSQGSGVIVQPPVFQSFASVISGLDREVVNNPLLFEEGKYTMNFTDLAAKAADPSNKLMILCSPHNPVGRVWLPDELRKVAEICLANDVLLITDEIHCDIIYPGHKFTGMTSIYEGISDLIIMVGSAGKSFGVPGLVDSFIYTPSSTLKNSIQARIMKFHLAKSNAFANTALETVYAEGDQWLDDFVGYMADNVSLIQEFCQDAANKVELIEPEGTYQVWLDFRAYTESEEELLKILADTAKVGLNPGSSYGTGGDKFFRMNIGCPQSEIALALEGIKKALLGL